MRRLLDPRLQGERARHAVYDLVVLLSVLVALRDTETPTARVGLYLLLTLLGVAFAEVYAALVSRTLSERRPPTAAERAELAVEVLGGLLLGGVPLVWLALGALGLLERATALDLALWTGLVLLGAYATFGAHAARLPLRRSLLWGAGVTLVGVALVLLKALLH